MHRWLSHCALSMHGSPKSLRSASGSIGIGGASTTSHVIVVGSQSGPLALLDAQPTTNRIQSHLIGAQPNIAAILDASLLYRAPDDVVRQKGYFASTVSA